MFSLLYFGNGKIEHLDLDSIEIREKCILYYNNSLLDRACMYICAAGILEQDLDALGRCWRNALVPFTHVFGQEIKILAIHRNLMNFFEPVNPAPQSVGTLYTISNNFSIHSPDPNHIVLSCGWIRSLDNDQGCYNYGERLNANLACKFDAELYLQLLTWRLLPELDPSKITSLRVCIVGAGTLGCMLARQLLGWGVGHFVIVDNARVTNATRQSLYIHSDLNEYKAQVACKAIKEIRPDADATPMIFTVPQPGHRMEQIELQKSLELLHKAMEQCDCVFLATDSKASRLPLDETCTLVKPTTCSMCASVAAELLVSLTQHEHHFQAPHGSESCLGSTPHCIQMSISGNHPLLNACIFSPEIIQEFAKDEQAFLSKIPLALVTTPPVLVPNVFKILNILSIRESPYSQNGLIVGVTQRCLLSPFTFLYAPVIVTNCSRASLFNYPVAALRFWE
ncbi:bifunctional THIF-type NAD-FAD binding fold/ThiF-MoeB-HesA family/Ubiquitin-activating enzyme [Babesia duncani]|uniref:Bifunctional THIF-type NAD-FAD binding fold/ThiF-MoeB-HesA family/Ubiquitin-activating enzyme n=1 Tax=Babesia duncani TaxID=323732 RepID=A0AAD9PLE4_9APIC|nr:bifunctional THIF-type NAD-FAD binding fold/ThiF-MoeB-HesA family/Ubiquitin-activating enzyme [Babesia duncani]